MNQWIKCLCGTFLTAGLCLSIAGTALAHTMPIEEATMILPKPPYGQMEIVPHETPMENLDAFGVQFIEKSSINNGRFRFVRYSVYSGTFVFFARTGADDVRPAAELCVSDYDIKDVSLHTPSNFMVSGRYEDVVEKYGEADHVERETPARTSYRYDFEEHAASLLFEVDEDGKIRVIRYRSQA